jgi:glycolate oxidase iron-sulfur subunit
MFAPKIKEDLYSCLKCAMCQPVCPTYRVTKMERHAPRGRVQMVKKYLEGDLSITKSLHEALMSCILCESCAHACPSGVRLDRVFENMRMELHEQLGTKLTKRMLFQVLQNPMLLRLGAKIGRIGREAFIVPLNVSWKLGAIPVNRLPRFNSSSFRSRMGETVPAKGKRVGRVLYFTGCATDLINEDVGEAVVDVLTSLGIEVIIPQDQVCCSVPIFLSGARKEALANVYKNLALFDRDDADAIVVDCATCGGGLKKSIPNLVEDLGGDVEKARRVALKVRDVSEIVADRLEELELDDRSGTRRRKVTYHDPCHMVRSMNISEPPRRILKALPDIEFTELTGADECCGGAGSFQFEHVEISKGVTARKTTNIRAAGAELVATGCPGCRLTLSGNLYEEGDPHVVHTLQLVAERLRK